MRRRQNQLPQLPGRDLAFVIRFQGDHHEGPLAPFLVFDADGGGFQDRLVPAQQVLQIQGGDPLPAALDHVLDAIGDLDLALPVDVAHIPTVQPACAPELG